MSSESEENIFRLGPDAPLKHPDWEARTQEANQRMIRCLLVNKVMWFYFWSSVGVLGLGGFLYLILNNTIGEPVMILGAGVFLGVQVLTFWNNSRIDNLMLYDEVLVYA